MPKRKVSRKSRYSRQQLLPYWNQRKIKGGKVIIAGVGALGTMAATNLAMMGVGTLVLIDMDTIELSNLSRQLLFRKGDIGKFKVDIAAREIKVINSLVNVITFAGRIQDSPPELFKAKKNEEIVILEGFDNFDARRWINSKAVSENILLVSGGMYGMLGNVQVVIPHETACLDCQPLIPEKQLQKACTPPGKKRATKKLEKPDLIPTVASVSSVIAGIMTQEAIKILLKQKEAIMKEYLFWDGMSESFVKLHLQRRETCVTCSDKFQIAGVSFQASPNESFEQLYNRLKLTFLAKDPELMVNAQTIPFNEQNKTKEVKSLLKDKSLIFLIDDELPTPIKIKIVFSPARKRKRRKK